MKIEDAVLQREWLVACRSDELTEQPLGITLMGERVVLFRNEEGIHAFKDLCIHRGAKLSLGCVKDGNLVCPYHAWEYDSSGACVRIPQLPEDRAIPGKARTVKYACQEQFGLIWVCLDADQSAPFFELPEWEDSKYRNVMWGKTLVEAKPPRVIENFLDVGHLAVVHVGYLGVAEHTIIGDYHVIQEGNSIRSEEIAVFQPDPDGSGQAKNVYYTYEILRPMTVKFTKRDKETDQKMSIILTVAPVDTTTSIAYGILSFNYPMNQTDAEIAAFQDVIFAQDKPVVENQKPEDLPLDLQAELSLACDRMSIAYRRYLKDMGLQWGTA
ncbi:(2Fe-2S)-binding protein [Paenibacillus selenitireducens]|uniref:(2Fe-2S)-binding protein n=1 Tax=Paenibacillus selenitireducens TaxID=1324314 RepID=A0A1T2X3J7_9BACL|nr:aromatic ring-hydroxylating dioxygenase subunit alpha [Paenibacillus selenitireducens]OPA74296.1 (2Fe-2S)-binding protein [Paenibacillus selenitireducens]